MGDDSEFEGFTRGEATLPRVETGSVAELAHKRLDEILGWLNEGSGGGDFMITDLDTGRTYRITFCDFTGQAKCKACGSTGAEGSNFSLDPLDVSGN